MPKHTVYVAVKTVRNCPHGPTCDACPRIKTRLEALFPGVVIQELLSSTGGDSPLDQLLVESVLAFTADAEVDAQALATGAITDINQMIGPPHFSRIGDAFTRARPSKVSLIF